MTAGEALKTTDRNVEQGGPMRFSRRVRVHCDGYFTRYASPPIPAAGEALDCILGSGFEPSQSSLPRPRRGKDFRPLITVLEPGTGLVVVREMKRAPFSAVRFVVHESPRRSGDDLVIDYGATFTFDDRDAYLDEAEALLGEARRTLAALKGVLRVTRAIVQQQCVLDRVVPREEHAQIQFFFELFDHRGSVKVPIPIFHKYGERDAHDVIDAHVGAPLLTTSVAAGPLLLTQKAAELDRPMSVPEFMESAADAWGTLDTSAEVVGGTGMASKVRSWGRIERTLWASAEKATGAIEGVKRVPVLGKILTAADLLLIAGGAALDLTRKIPAAMSEPELEAVLSPLLADIASTRTVSARAAKSALALSSALAAITALDHRSIVERTRRSRALRSLAWRAGKLWLDSVMSGIAVAGIVAALAAEGVSFGVATLVIVPLGGSLWAASEALDGAVDQKIAEVHRVTRAELAQENAARTASSTGAVEQARKLLADHHARGGVLTASLFCEWTPEGLTLHDAAAPWGTQKPRSTTSPPAGITY